MDEMLTPERLAQGAQFTAVALWALVLLVGVWLRLRASRARLWRRERAGRIDPARFSPALALVPVGVVGLVAAALTVSGHLAALERPVREQLWRMRQPMAPRLLPEAAIIDFRCRRMPVGAGLWFAERAHEDGARAVLLAPPSAEMDGIRNLPECTPLPETEESATRPETGMRLLEREIPVFVAYADPETARGLRDRSRGQGRVGHFTPSFRGGRYQLLNMTTTAAGEAELSAAVLLAAEFSGIRPADVRSDSRSDLRYRDTPLPLLRDGSLIVAATPPPLAADELKVRDPVLFLQHAEGSDYVAHDTTWAEFCEDRLVLMGVYSSLEQGTSRLALTYWAANTILAHLRRAQGEPLPGLYLPLPVWGPAAGVWVLLAALLGGVVGLLFRPVPAGALLVGLTLALLATTAAACLGQEVILPAGSMVVALLVAGAVAMHLSWIFIEAKRDQVEANLGRYVSPEVAAEVVRVGTPSLGGERRRVTVLFADVRSFGLIAERLEPEYLVELLNAYFTAAVDVVFEHGGTLDKFMGDGIMAVWGAPVQHPDDAVSAVRAAVEICSRAAGLTAERTGAGLETASLALGVSTGDAIAGNIGDERRMEYTVIGDAVNVAARLQSLASAGEADVVIGEATWQQVRDVFPAESLGEVTVKHRAEPVKAYSIDCQQPASESERA